jgi:hypothetical protein
LYKLTVSFLLLCGLCSAQNDSCSFFGNKPIYPYYYPSPLNGKDFYTTKKEFGKVITAKTNFDGIITVIFFINYKGETGYYRIQVCNADYTPLEIDSNNSLLCEQALQAVKQSGPWKPASGKEIGPVNSRKFYSFRFKQGTLVEILPK